jgi:flagellar motor switch protein FliG
MTEKTIVLTTYGKGDEIESVSVNLFDREDSYYSRDAINPAKYYCLNINDLELKDDRWVYAQIISQNEKIMLRKPLQFDIIHKLEDRDLQRVLKEVKRFDLIRALKGTEDSIKDKIFNNMSKRAVAVLKEDMETVHAVGKDEIKSAKARIIEVIQKLSANDNIGIAWGKK